MIIYITSALLLVLIALAAARVLLRRYWPKQVESVTIVRHGRFPYNRTAIVYVAGCDGLKAIRRSSGADPRCWWKIGAVRADRDDGHAALERRLEALGRCAYGGCIRQRGRMIEEPGFREWRLQRLALPDGFERRSDLSMGSAGLVVQLPRELSFEQFEARLRNALDDISWRSLTCGQRCRAGARYSLRDGGHAAATELFSLQPRRSADVGLLVSAITAILDAPR